MKYGEEPAYPLASEELSDRLHEGISLYTGITIRDYFAAKAMQTIISRCYNDEQRQVAKLSYEMADEMLKAREQ